MALEFAILAPVLYFLILALIDYSVYDYRRSELQFILYEASRSVQVGDLAQVTGEQNKRIEFQKRVCDAVVAAIACEDVYFDVRRFSSITDISLPDAEFDAAGVPTNFVFEPGGSEEITVMRAATPHRFGTGYLARLFGDAEGRAILVGFSVAKNEPFPES